MNPFALTAEERAGAMMAPARTPDVGAFMNNLGALRAMLGGSVVVRMQAHGEGQEARWDAGERSPTPLTEDRVWLADDVAGALLGPMAMAGIFAGVGAKTANKAALETAQRMASEGADPRAIWRDTGWFQGPEGKWRWEIDDSGVAIDPSQMRNRPGREESVGRTSEFLLLVPHRELLEAYPDTGGIKGRITVGSYQPEEGAIKNWGNERIRITAPDGERARSVALHELQHAVQGREGFARGANVSEYARGPMFSKEATALKDDLSVALVGGVSASAAEILESVKYFRDSDLERIAKEHGFSSADDALDFLRKEDEKRTPYSQYRRTAGEAEARAVQARQDMTPEQRRATFPLDSYDVPLRDLIIRDVASAIRALLVKSSGGGRER